jgi:predicted ABC-type ATPase
MADRILGRYLNCREFVNADVIAKGLSSFQPEKVALEAGRVMLRRLDELAQQRVDFAFETTLASRTFAPWLRKRQEEGYRFHLFFAWLPHPDMAVTRVGLRVAAGGHNIPERDIRRRYERGIANFLGLYMSLADTWEVYDNSGMTRLMARGNRLRSPEICDPAGWRAFTQKSA